MKLLGLPGGTAVDVAVHETYIHIWESYKITSKKEMLSLLYIIKDKFSDNKYSEWYVQKGDITDMIDEWRAHNLLYNLHIKRAQTADSDLNENKWYVKLCYKVLSVLYSLYNK